MAAARRERSRRPRRTRLPVTALAHLPRAARLRTGPAVVSTWRVQAPNRLAYEVKGGWSGVVIGAATLGPRPWRDHWTASAQTPLHQPVPFWVSVTDAHILGNLTFAGRAGRPGLVLRPWLARLVHARDRPQDGRTLDSHMVTNAHFMHDTYGSFNTTPPIVPPQLTTLSRWPKRHSPRSADELEQAQRVAERLSREHRAVVLGKHEEIALVLAALISGGHVLLEDVPGTAKTILARAIAQSIEGASFARIQCTPDLQPTDVTGLSIYNQKTREFEFRPGPIFANDRARRRDQPRDAAHAVGAARGDGRAPGDGRRRDARAARAVPRHRDREPDRARGDVPAARGAARPVRAALGARLSVARTRRSRSSSRSATAIRSRRSSRRSTRTSSRRCARAVEDVYVDELIVRWIVDLVRATRDGRGRRDRRVGARQPDARAHRARVGAAARPRPRRCPATSSSCSCPCSATGCCSRRRTLAETRALGRDEALARIKERCLELAPPPAPTGTADASGRRASGEHVPARSAARRSPGLPFGDLRVAPPRPRQRRDRLAARTEPGDPVSTIDWRATRALSAATGRDEFIVRERARRRRAARRARARPPAGDGALPAAAAVAVEADGAARGRRPRRRERRRRARRRRLARLRGRRAAHWLPPGRARPAASSSRTRSATTPRSTRPRTTLDARVRRSSARLARDLPGRQLRLRPLRLPRAAAPRRWLDAAAHGWDVVPVVIQDPVWEQSFPDVAGAALPVADPATAALELVRLSRARGARAARANVAPPAAAREELARSASSRSCSGRATRTRSTARSSSGPRSGGGAAARREQDRSRARRGLRAARRCLRSRLLPLRTGECCAVASGRSRVKARLRPGDGRVRRRGSRRASSSRSTAPPSRPRTLQVATASRR